MWGHWKRYFIDIFMYWNSKLSYYSCRCVCDTSNYSIVLSHVINGLKLPTDEPVYVVSCLIFCIDKLYQ